MARHKVISFKVNISPSGDAVHVQIVTEIKKPYKFKLTPDASYPTVQIIEEKLNSALNHCVDTYEKVDVSVDKGRPFVWINVKDFIGTRFAGREI